MDIKLVIFFILMFLICTMAFLLARFLYDRYEIVPKKPRPLAINSGHTIERGAKSENTETEIDESIFKKETTIDGIEYVLIPKLESLTKTQFISYVCYKEKIEFRVGDNVHFKDENIKKIVGDIKFKVLSFEPYLINGLRVDAYLNVELKEIISGKIVYYLSSALEKTI